MELKSHAFSVELPTHVLKDPETKVKVVVTVPYLQVIESCRGEGELHLVRAQRNRVCKLCALDFVAMLLAEDYRATPRPVNVQPKTVLLTHFGDRLEGIVRAEDRRASSSVDIEGRLAL